MKRSLTFSCQLPLAELDSEQSEVLNQIVKAYDVRGLSPEQLDANLALRLGFGFAGLLSETPDQPKKVLIGRDVRESGIELSAAFSEGLLMSGFDVIDLGLVSTDQLYFASGTMGCAGAVFTASHNPAGYNGIKMCFAGAGPISAESGLARISEIAAAEISLGTELSGDATCAKRVTSNATAQQTATGQTATGQATIGQIATGQMITDVETPTQLGELSKKDVLTDFVRHVRSFIDLDALAGLKVVVDTANGIGGLVVPAVFEGLGMHVTYLFAELDGTFPNHPADPLDEANQVDLCREVLACKADIGLAFDGDADRVFIVDDLAQPLSGSLTTALVAQQLLKTNPGATVLHNLICSKVVAEVVTEGSGTPLVTRVGHSFIKAEMARTQALFAGEHSGHYYFKDNFRADSGVIAALLVLETLGKHKQSLSELRKPLQRYFESGEINFKVPSPKAVIDRVGAKLAKQYPTASINHLDGLSMDLGQWWFNLRPSNTEPLLRLNLEAETEDFCKQGVEELTQLIEQLAT